MTLPAWHLHLDVWVVLGSIVAAYLIAVRRHAQATGEPIDRRHRTMFLVGMAILWVASDWPMHDLSERYLYSMHMVQHMLFTLVAAPFLVAGTPAWMWRALLRPRAVHTVWRFLTRPLVALLFFNGVLLFTHWPEIVALSVGSELAHFLLHSLILFSGLVMWWPVVSPLPEMPPLTPPGQMLYLFLQSIAPTIPASFLTFGHTVLYEPYATFPRIWGWTALEDQMLAGLIMKIIGGLILWGVIAAVFFRWASRETRDGWDPLRWRDVDAEIRAEVTR